MRVLEPFLGTRAEVEHMISTLREPQDALQARMALAALPCIPLRLPSPLGDSSVAGARYVHGLTPSAGVRLMSQPIHAEMEQDVQVNAVCASRCGCMHVRDDMLCCTVTLWLLVPKHIMLQQSYTLACASLETVDGHTRYLCEWLLLPLCSGQTTFLAVIAAA